MPESITPPTQGRLTPDLLALYQERGLRALDIASTWLAVAHVGALGFVYNAALSGDLAFGEEVRHLCGIFLFGAVSAFMSKTMTALYFLRGEWPFTKHVVWASFVSSGVGLIVGLAGPLMTPLISN